MECRNCCNKANGHYCSTCGQRIIKGRLQLHQVLVDLKESFNLDSGFLLTLGRLIIAPHLLVNEYLFGARRKYFNPIKFYLITFSVNVLIVTIFTKQTAEIDFLNSPIWLLFSLFVFIPLYSFFSYLLTKSKFNFVENIVLNFFAFGIINILNTVFFFVRKFFNFYFISTVSLYIMYFSILIPVIYLTWFYYNLIKKNILLVLIFCLLNYFASFLINLLILLILGFTFNF